MLSLRYICISIFLKLPLLSSALEWCLKYANHPSFPLQQLYTSAQLHSDALANDSLESIQAILLCAMYSLRSLTGPSLWYECKKQPDLSPIISVMIIILLLPHCI